MKQPRFFFEPRYAKELCLGDDSHHDHRGLLHADPDDGIGDRLGPVRARVQRTVCDGDEAARDRRVSADRGCEWRNIAVRGREQLLDSQDVIGHRGWLDLVAHQRSAQHAPESELLRCLTF